MKIMEEEEKDKNSDHGSVTFPFSADPTALPLSDGVVHTRERALECVCVRL